MRSSLLLASPMAFFHRLGELQNYRWASVALIGAVILVPVLAVALGASDWIAVLVALPIYVALVVLTYRRLRNAGLTGWWIVWMILALNFGPRWDGPAPLTFYLSHLLHLIPVALGWLVRGPRTVAATGAHRDASTSV
jgi:uncharacterized membrane protein YhaH (DUF805 family)